MSLRIFILSKQPFWNFYLTFFTFVYLTSAYNLDVDNVRVFHDPTHPGNRRGSYFGYSVALYASAKDFVLLVGAPRANITEIENTIEPGSVYRCGESNECTEWIIDRSGNGALAYRSVNQIKDNAWIGATITVENKTDPKVVVCAPRWKQKVLRNNRQDWFMNGACYLKTIIDSNSFQTEADEYLIPLLNPAQQIISVSDVKIYNFGMGEAGFSMHMISSDSKWTIVLGSPGLYNWRGLPVIISNSLTSSHRTTIPLMREERRFHVDYSGYSVTSGCYFNKNELWLATGAPRANDLHGVVTIFSLPSTSGRNVVVKRYVEGEQHGEYFGATLASCDLNNDNKDELIVGAPFWTREVDEGRVYIFSARYNEYFEVQKLEGEVAGGRFGLTITCLGDIDYDGLADFAVGAPYEKDIGAVYIFNGNANGFPRTYSQKIMGSQFAQKIRGFGISISPPRDVNFDHYPDVAIGAYLSEHVVLLKTKPVVTITTMLSPTGTSKLLRNSTSFDIDICTSYRGAYVPNQLRIIRFLKVDPMFGRATHDAIKGSDNAYKLPGSIQKSNIKCDLIKINLKENIQNIIDPVEISVAVLLEEDSKVTKKDKSFIYNSSATVNKLLSRTEDTLKLPFVVDCGDDDVCTSDLRISLTTDLSSNKYIVGSSSTVKLNVTVYNYDEPAYQSKAHIYIPEILPLASVPAKCAEGLQDDGILEVICDVGNPLRKSETVILEVDMNVVRFDVTSVDLWSNITTQSELKSTENSTNLLTMYFDVDIDIAIAGKTQEDLYSYYVAESEQQLDSIRFQHIYEVQQLGVSPIEEAILWINIPLFWKYSSKDIEIATVNQIVGHMDGRSFYCINTNYTHSFLSSPFYKHRSHSGAVVSNQTHDRFTIEPDTPINVPVANRTIYINCTNTNVQCNRIECKLGPFINSLSVARLTLTVDLQLSNFKSDLLEDKDIIFFVSEGGVDIIEPFNATQRIGHKPDSTIVATTFLGSPIAQRVAIWIIVLSVFMGILLLILLILGLIKIGFFDRKKKEELEALKAESDNTYGIVLETSSSQEVLDRN